MNKFLIVLCVLVPLVICDPGHGSYVHLPVKHGYYKRHGGATSYQSQSHPVCKTVYDVTYSKKCSTTYTDECKTVSETAYRTEYDTACTTVSETKCTPVTRQVTDKQCSTKHVKSCVNEARKVPHTTYVDKCENVHTKVCHPVSVAVAHHPVRYGVAHAKVGRRVHGLGKREATHGGYVAASHPRCTTKVEHVCKKVPVQSHRVVHVPKCTSVPTTDCVDVVKHVTEESCVEVPRQECTKVAKQVPYSVPKQVCTKVPQEHCVQVPHKVARQECIGAVTTSSKVNHGHHYGHH